MQFSDDTNYSGLIEDIDFLIWGKGTEFHSNYSMEDRTRNLNLAYDKAVVQLLKADPDWQWDDTTSEDLPIAEASLIAGRKHYTFPADLSMIYRVRVKDRNGNFRTLEPVSRREISDSELDDKGTPDKYYKIGNSLFPVPIPDYGTGNNVGLEVQVQRNADYFDKSDTDKEPGFSRQFHEYLSLDAARRYARAEDMHDKAKTLQGQIQQKKEEMKNYYQSRAKDEKPQLDVGKTNPKHYGLS